MIFFLHHQNNKSKLPLLIDTVVTLDFDPSGKYLAALDWNGMFVISEVDNNSHVYSSFLGGSGGN